MTDKLIEALEWALNEINGRTRYDNDEQLDRCLDIAEAALASAKAEPVAPPRTAEQERADVVAHAIKTGSPDLAYDFEHGAHIGAAHDPN